jgi:probable HAF family extracellular repeat protein
MRLTKWMSSITVALLTVLAVPLHVAGQDNAKADHPHQYHHYQLNDVGTFGGPQSFQYAPQLPRAGVMNDEGTLVGYADTLTVDPYCLDVPDCYAAQAFQWQDRVTTDLGVLPGGVFSQVNWISANGLMAGVSDNGQPDPLSGGTLPQIYGVLWEHGRMTALGPLPEGGYETWPTAVNRRGEVVGNAQNTVPDSYSMLLGYGYQMRAFYWKNGSIQDLGTLGTGTDAQATVINEHGQVIGVSYTSSAPSAFCTNVQSGFPLTTGSFIWDKKNGMKDLGGFGGTCTIAYDLNNRGQVVGQSNHPDDLAQHPFVWDRATGITELPTGAGVYGSALAVDDAGKVVGSGDAPDGQASATLWRKTGGKWQTTYLGRLHNGDCAFGASTNAAGQVVGSSGPNGCSTTLPFLWQDGGPMVDLNTLVPANSGIQLVEAVQINYPGEIAVNGVDANGNNHAVLLIPCDENHLGVAGCDYSLVDAVKAAAQDPGPRYAPSTTQRLPQPSSRYHMPAVQSPSR